MHATLERPIVLPPLASVLTPRRDRRMDITALCDANSSSSNANDLYDREVQTQLAQIAHHSRPLYRVEHDRMLERLSDWRASSTTSDSVATAPIATTSNSNNKLFATAMQRDNPLVVAASNAHLHNTNPIAVLSTVAAAQLPTALRPPRAPQPATAPTTAPTTQRARTRKPTSTTTNASKKRSRRMSNSERGKLYRSRRKTYVETLACDVADLAQEVASLQQYGALRHDLVAQSQSPRLALQRVVAPDTCYSRVVVEYFTVFRAGMPVDDAMDDASTPLALDHVQPTPRQAAFVETLMARDMAFCGTGGPQRLLRNWQCFSRFHTTLQYSLLTLRIVARDATAAIVAADAMLRVRLSRATLEQMFPHVLANASLVAQLVGLEIDYPVTNIFYFGGPHNTICRYESFVDFLAPFTQALGSVEAALALAGPITERQQREQLVAQQSLLSCRVDDDEEIGGSDTTVTE